MLTHPTLDLLHQLELNGMAKAFGEIEASAEATTLTHPEWLGLLLDQEVSYRRDRRLLARLRYARLRHQASVEDIDYRAARGLDRALFQKLAACGWIDAHENLILCGPTGIGKSWLASALGHKACRDNRSVLYQRIPKLFAEHARELLSSGALPADRVALAEHRIPLISEGYFLLNKAYKDWRLPDGHFTELPKIVALQAVVISRLQPFFPLQSPVDRVDVGVIRCNEIFACSYALGVIEHDFQPDTPQKVDFWLRLLDIIAAPSCETIEPYIMDKMFEIKRPLEDFQLSVLDPDKPIINSLISIFELCQRKENKF